MTCFGSTPTATSGLAAFSSTITLNVSVNKCVITTVEAQTSEQEPLRNLNHRQQIIYFCGLVIYSQY